MQTLSLSVIMGLDTVGYGLWEEKLITRFPSARSTFPLFPCSYIPLSLMRAV
jgi:hypothetical protein